jgi:hypothetical protein
LQPDGEDLSFIVFSDVQQGYGIFSQLAKVMADIKPAPCAAFCCGDIMLRPANEAEWLNFWRYARPVTEEMPLFIARGNHEGNDPGSELVLRQQAEFPGDNFYYTHQADDILFIILDTEINGQKSCITGAQFEWLKSTLDSASANAGIGNIFILMHHPLYPQGFHSGSNLQNADELHQLFLQHDKIRAVFAGHDHLFNHYEKDGLHYITTGGGGASLYHGYGGDYHHFVKVSVFNNPFRINIKTIGIFYEIVEDFDL